MKSPFTHILNTNYVPSHSEIYQIQEYLQGPTEELSRLETEISRTQALLEKLRSKRDELEQGVNSHRALISPVRRLPHDILREIFVACLPSDRNAVMSAQEAPVLLGRICSTWRSISLTTPRLWASLHLPIPMTVDVTVQQLYKRNEVARNWLRRAGSCPLSISLYSREFFGNNEHLKPGLDSALGTLLSLTRQWKKICVDIPIHQLSLVSRLTAKDVPNMESLRLAGAPQWGVPVYWQGLHIFQAPLLRSLVINYADPSFVHSSVRWSNLTKLDVENAAYHLNGLSVTDVLALAHKCPNLISCRFGISTRDMSGGTTSHLSVAVLPHLQTLSVMEGDQVDVIRLFNLLELPSLRHVTFRSANWQPGRPTPLLTLLSRPRSVNIECLDFDWATAPQAEFLQCLELVPCVTRLDIITHRQGWSVGPAPTVFDDKCLERLTPAAGVVHLCPQLKSITCINADFSEEIMLKFIEARTSAAYPAVEHLKKMDVVFERAKNVDLSAKLAQLASMGVDVSLKYQYAGTSHGSLSPWLGTKGVDEIQFL